MTDPNDFVRPDDARYSEGFDDGFEHGVTQGQQDILLTLTNILPEPDLDMLLEQIYEGLDAEASYLE